MSNFVMLIACLIGGLLLRRGGRLPDGAHVVINNVIMHVSLPAVTLRYVHDFRFDGGALWPVLMPWMLFLVGAALFFAAGRLLQLPAASVGALTLLGGFGNTSFVGLPMIEVLHGPEGLGLGLLVDQLGSYLALSTLGVGAATYYAASGSVSASAMFRRIASFPPFVALVAALLLTPLPFPPFFSQALARIGDTLAPLALLSVGLQLHFGELKEHRRLLCLGLGYKLLICPAIVLALLWLSDGSHDTASRVSLIEASMPPMMGAAVVAAQANLAPRFVSMMVGLGIPLGLCTAPLWSWLFGTFGS